MSTSEWSGRGWAVTVTDTETAFAQASGPVTISSVNAARLEVRRRWFRWSLRNGRQLLVHLRGITKTEASALSGALRRLAVTPAVADAVAWHAAGLVGAVVVRRSLVMVTSKPSAWIWRMWLRIFRSVSVRAWW